MSSMRRKKAGAMEIGGCLRMPDLRRNKGTQAAVLQHSGEGNHHQQKSDVSAGNGPGDTKKVKS